MVDVNPTGVTLTIQNESEKITHYAPFHQLGPFDPMMITGITVGANVAMYGNILKNIEGRNVQEYIHLRRGNYAFEKPIQLLTFHADII